MRAIYVPAKLIGHHTDMVAIAPVFRCVVLKIDSVADREYYVEKVFYLSRFLFCNKYTFFIYVARATEDCHVLYSNKHEKRLCGIGTEIEMLLVIILACGIQRVNVGVGGFIKGFFSIIAVNQFPVSTTKVCLHPSFGKW